MLPDYIIYDELERQRREQNQERPRKRVELPKDPPEFDDAERQDEDDHDRQDDNRGVTIIEI